MVVLVYQSVVFFDPTCGKTTMARIPAESHLLRPPDPPHIAWSPQDVPEIQRRAPRC